MVCKLNHYNNRVRKANLKTCDFKIQSSQYKSKFLSERTFAFFKTFHNFLVDLSDQYLEDLKFSFRECDNFPLKFLKEETEEDFDLFLEIDVEDVEIDNENDDITKKDLLDFYEKWFIEDNCWIVGIDPDPH